MELKAELYAVALVRGSDIELVAGPYVSWDEAQDKCSSLSDRSLYRKHTVVHTSAPLAWEEY